MVGSSHSYLGTSRLSLKFFKYSHVHLRVIQDNVFEVCYLLPCIVAKIAVLLIQASWHDTDPFRARFAKSPASS
jgi:hypothetical protein